MKKYRRPKDRAAVKADPALFLRGGCVMSMLMVAVVMVASCSGDGDQSGSPLDDDAADQGSTETTSDGSADAGAEPGAEVEGAFAFAVDFRTGELWAINPDTQHHRRRASYRDRQNG